jgi:hypothetical protein
MVSIAVNSTITTAGVPWTGKTFSTGKDPYYWGTIKEDIGGSTYYDDIGLASYTYKSAFPTPDGTVDIKDVSAASKAYGTIPGDARWWSQADVNRDYTIDIKDIAAISKKYGY